MKKSKKGEFKFYEGIKERQSRHKELLLSITPKYLGIEGENIILENLMQNMEVPCVIDIKIGFRTYFEDLKPQKVDYMKNKDILSTTGSIGVRYSGMHIRDKDNKTIHQIQKQDQLSIDPDGFL